MHEIIKDARRLYQETVSHPSYQDIARTQIWDKASGNWDYQKRLRESCNGPEEVIKSLEGSDMYAITIRSGELFELMMEWHLRDELVTQYPLLTFFQKAYGDELTPNLCKMICYLSKMVANGLHKGGDKQNILELGGGNGQFHRILRDWSILKDASIRYFDIDIPESLYCAYVCIRHWHPELKVLWVTSETKKEDIQAYDVVLVPHHFAEVLEFGRYQWFVNTASLGEMPNETIRKWIDFIEDKVVVEKVFCFNRFLNTVSRKEVERARGEWGHQRTKENEASVAFAPSWNVLEWEVEPDFSRCPYEDTRIARYLMLVLESGEKGRIANYNLEKIKMEDWWRYRAVESVSTYRSNQLVNDMTMSGTLFQLWEANRVHPSRDTAHMMITYLGHLLRSDGLAFEEEFFYRKLL